MASATPQDGILRALQADFRFCELSSASISKEYSILLQRNYVSQTLGSFFVGFGLGAIMGGRHGALQYKVENLHWPPRSRTELFFYIRERNYRVMQSAFTKGVGFGLRIAVCVGAFNLLRWSLVHVRRVDDPTNGVIAGSSVGLIYGVTGILDLVCT